jgi:hypothetical protein
MIVFHWLLSHSLQPGVSSRGTIENKVIMEYRTSMWPCLTTEPSSYLSIFDLLLYLFHTIYKVVI